MNTPGKILLFAAVAVVFTSCIVRKPPYHKWVYRHHYKFRYHKGNNFGGRRFWVKPWRTYK